MEVNLTPETVFIACPTHDGRIDARTATAIFQKSSQSHNAIICIKQSSLLAHNCNDLWCAALNARNKYGIKWFAMIHADVVPEAFWLDKMITIAETHSADLLSAIIPIKTKDGLTSTALSGKDGMGVFKRFTQTEIHDKDFPETFCVNDLMWSGNSRMLLVNTGCMICRIDQPWSDQVHFNISDGIRKVFNQYTPTVDPEDWFFSRLVAVNGGRVMATKAIQVTHIGYTGYDSHAVWGHATDPKAEL